MTATPSGHPLLDRLLADVDAPVRRVVFARGVEACRASEDDGWSVPTVTTHGAQASQSAPNAVPNAVPDAAPDARPRPTAASATLSALGLRPVEPARAASTSAPRDTRDMRDAHDARDEDPVAVAARHGLAPLLISLAGAPSAGGAGDAVRLVSAAGALGWRPPIERLYDDPALGPRAMRLRFLLDAIEHHAVRSAEAYASAGSAARRTAALFDTHDLTTLAGQTALFVELDALLASVQRAYGAAARLLVAAFPARRARDPHARPADLGADPASFDTLVLAARSAPAELRERLLDAWETHGAHARAYRRGLRRRDAREVGHAPVQLARLACGVWAVSVPVPAPPGDGAHADAPNAHLPRRRVDALERAWAIATDAMRVVSLVTYAASER